jgi:hypothetical protein
MSSFRREGAIVAALALALVACNKKEPAAPAPPPQGIPPLDQPVANDKPGDHPTHEPSKAGEAPSLPPGHPPLAAGQPGAAPTGGGMQGIEGATPGDIPFDAKTVIAGQLKLSAKVKDQVKPGDVIFLVARKYDPSGAAGMPLAVRKLIAGTFPMSFSIDSRDAMVAGTQLAGKVVVTARVDKDGDAITKNPGDVTGQSKAIEPPNQKVVVDLDTVL